MSVADAAPRMLLSRWMHALTIAAHLALIILLLIAVPSRLGIASALLLFVPLPGLLRGSLYTCKWASMLLVFYCALLLSGGYAAPAQRGLLFGLAALAAADFVGMVLFVRFSAREALALRR
ncbi:DUF2069 domain-containing protein [Solimonas soli]|uniref:DUF2069 domain-containing protein n=1 Tax=Solimonas soli TaxID=413479 RepID=UPI0004B30198|nr:DUF2069 domain-containing protein [Solimonas soli]